MKPSESTDCEVVETEHLAVVDIFIETEGRGVVMTLSADDSEKDIAILLTPDLARETGEVLYRHGCTAAYAVAPQPPA